MSRPIGLMVFAVLFCACGASTLDAAVYSANGARATEVAASDLLREHCTDRYKAAAKLDRTLILDRIRDLDRLCMPARKGVGVLRSARLVLLAAILTYQATGNEAPLRLAIARVAAAAESTAKTVERLESP